MKYSFLYKICMCLLAVTFAVAAEAQQKVPDVTRFSKAPVAPEGGGAARMAARSAGIQTRRTSLDSFTHAPVKPGGTGKAGSARTTARTVIMPAGVALPSNTQAAREPGTQKKVTAIPDAIQEQLNMKQPAAEVVPAKPAAAKKAPARS